MDTLHQAAEWILSVLCVLYLVTVVFFILFGARIAWNPALMPLSQRAAQDISFRSAVTLSRSQRLMNVLGVPSFFLVWPANSSGFRSFNQRYNNRSGFALGALQPADRRIALSSLALAVLAALLTFWGLLFPIMGDILLWGLLSATSLRHVSYLTGSLPQRLRRSRLNAYLSLLVIAVADAALLVVCVALLLGSPGAGTDLVGAFLALFNVPQNIGDFTSLAPSELLTGLLGLLFTTAVIKSALSPGQFSRTDEDLRSLAGYSLVAGQPDEVAGYLEHETQRTAQSWQLRAALSIQRGHYQQALKYTQRSLRTHGQEGTVDESTSRLAVECAGFAIPPEDRLALVSFLLGASCRDVYVYILLGSFASSGDFEAEARAAVSQCLPTSGYPVSHAHLLVCEGDIRGALSMLHQPDDASEDDLAEIARLLLQGFLTCISPDLDLDATVAALRVWHHEAWPQVMQRTSGGYEGAEQGLVVGGLLQIAHSVSRVLYLETAPDSHFIAELAQELTTHARTLSNSSREFDMIDRLSRDLLDRLVRSAMA